MQSQGKPRMVAITRQINHNIFSRKSLAKPKLTKITIGNYTFTMICNTCRCAEYNKLGLKTVGKMKTSCWVIDFILFKKIILFNLAR